MRKLIFSIVLTLLISIATLHAAENSLSGTYSLSGAKGPVVLILQSGETGTLTGSLKGGTLQAILQGAPVADGVFGSLTGADGKFLSFFQVAREGDKLQLDLVPSNAKGEPDFTKKSRLSFPVTNPQPENRGSESPKPETSKPEPPKPAPPANFSGTFKDETLTIESKAADAGYSGTIKLGGQAYQFTASDKEGTLHGEFESPDGKFPFEATLEGRTLKFTTEGTAYTLTKQGNPLAKPPIPPANPLTKPSPTPPEKAPEIAVSPVALPEKSSDSGAPWKIFKHEFTGLSVRYPADWKISGANGISLLTPPDMAQNEHGPMEIYLLLSKSAQGISGVDDPQFLPVVDSQIRQLAPYLQRVGDVKKVTEGATPGLVFIWEGNNPQGMKVRAEVTATLLNHYSVALLAMGDGDKIGARESVLKDVFSSLAAGAGDLDANLVGQWQSQGNSHDASGGFGGGAKSHFHLLSDGTCEWQVYAENSGAPVQSDKGRWTAANGHLFVVWDDGTTGDWNYALNTTTDGKRLSLKSRSGKADEWTPEG